MEENSEENKKKRRNIFKNEFCLRKRTRKRDQGGPFLIGRNWVLLNWPKWYTFKLAFPKTRIGRLFQ